MVVNFWSLNQSQQNLVGNILKLSIESGENKFLLIFLNEELFSRQTLPKITSSLIFKEILPDYLQKMIISASGLNSKEKDLFFNFLLSNAFRQGNAGIIMFIIEQYGIEFLKSQLNTFLQDKYLSYVVRKSIEGKKVPLTLMVALISTSKIPDDNNFCNMLLKSNFQNNYISFIEALMQEDILPGFLRLLQNMSTTDRDIIIKSLAINMPRQLELVRVLLEKLEPLDLKIEFYNKLTREAFNFYNKILLDELSAQAPPLNAETALAEVNQVTLQQLRGLDSSKVDFIQNRMVNFVKGYGHINYNDSLLTLAQRRSRKDYEFNPVLINQEGEVAGFFDILDTAKKPVEQSFVYACGHYVSGLISIDEMGKAKIVLIDSLGSTKGVHHEDFLREFSKHFPNNEIYISNETRQKTSTGCSVFALDDIAHFPKLRIEGHENFWDYGLVCT